MKKTSVSKKSRIAIVVLCVFTLVAALAACTPAKQENEGYRPNTPVVKKGSASEEPDAYGVIASDAWAEAYPDVYASFEKNAENAPGADKHDYLEYYPAINTLYAGYGFSKGYDEPASHWYALESILATPRISDATLANCITCKSPQFTALVNENGESEYSKPFMDTIADIDEPIGCYNCHENEPPNLIVGNQFFLTALGDDVSEVPVQAQVCGQCHNEYHFNTETKATTLPYDGLASMNPDDALAFYDSIDFVDWVYPGTGTPMLKAQHPEFETFYGGDDPSHMALIGYSCADCHMGVKTSEGGDPYTSHYWISPLENEELLNNDCNFCHEDLVKQVGEWQDRSESRVQSISLKLEDMVQQMVAQVESGELEGDELAELQKLHRSAQWYWDYVMVENSEGAHNPSFSDRYLDKAEDLVDQALALL